MTKKKRQAKTKGWQTPKNLMEAYGLNASYRDNPLTKKPERTPDFEKAYAFFDDLFQNRMNITEYSVKDIAEKRGVTYEEVEGWARQYDMFSFVLEDAKESCYENACTAATYGKLEFEEFLRYALVNLDDGEEKDRCLTALKKIEQENFDKSEKEIVMSEEIKPQEDNSVLKLSSFTAKEQARITEWDKKKADVATRFKFKTDSTCNSETKIITVILDREWNEDVEEDQKYWIANAALCSATGSSSSKYADVLFRQMVRATGKTDADSFNAMFKALLAMKPQDEYEGMLISRLIAIHEQYMNYMTFAATNMNNKESRESYINSATKLMRVYNETLETLNKHRRKGEQKVTVTHNHVNVNDGGKAIVGSEINQQPGGGVRDKK